MTIIQIIKIIISIILFIFMFLILFSKERRNYKTLAIITTVNLILLMNLGLEVIQKNSYIQVENYKKTSAQTVNDNTPPVISLKGKKDVYLSVGETYQEPGYSAVDDNDGSLVNRVKIQKQEINNNTYKLIYTVSDKAGNIGKQERTIHLQNPVKVEKPVKKTETQTQKKESSNKTEVRNQKKDNTNKTETKPIENKGVIYLTFDDGPSSSSTPKILDILKKEDVKATFFILNYTQSTEYLVKREVAEGHSVGIHGYSHDYKKIYKSVDAYMDNLNKLQDKIYKSTGLKTTITRFPGGSSNTISVFNPKIMTKLSKEVVAKGYRYYDWNVTSGDAGDVNTSKEVYNNVIKQLSKNNRNIVLMHDFANNNKTINALEDIIKYGKKNGYTFATITPATPMLKHRINN